jgi:hypothetical protein
VRTRARLWSSAMAPISAVGRYERRHQHAVV